MGSIRYLINKLSKKKIILDTLIFRVYNINNGQLAHLTNIRRAMKKALLENNYRSFWEKKTSSQIKKEIESWQKYFDKYGQSYSFHGGDMTPPNTLADGDKVLILKEILRER